MNAYFYQGNIYCEHCALLIRDTLALPETPDGNQYPIGPYSGGGGESDTPQHCTACALFLENPLTTEGLDYVREAMQSSRPGNVARYVWAPFYEIESEGN